MNKFSGAFDDFLKNTLKIENPETHNLIRKALMGVGVGAATMGGASALKNTKYERSKDKLTRVLKSMGLGAGLGGLAGSAIGVGSNAIERQNKINNSTGIGDMVLRTGLVGAGAYPGGTLAHPVLGGTAAGLYNRRQGGEIGKKFVENWAGKESFKDPLKLTEAVDRIKRFSPVTGNQKQFLAQNLTSLMNDPVTRKELLSGLSSTSPNVTQLNKNLTPETSGFARFLERYHGPSMTKAYSQAGGDWKGLRAMPGGLWNQVARWPSTLKAVGTGSTLSLLSSLAAQNFGPKITNPDALQYVGMKLNK